MNVRSSVSKEYNDLGVKCASSNIKTENAQSHSFPFSPGGAQQWRPIGPIHLHCEDEFQQVLGRSDQSVSENCENGTFGMGDKTHTIYEDKNSLVKK